MAWGNRSSWNDNILLALTNVLADISGANAVYFACPVSGIIRRIDTVVTGDPGAQGILTANINGGTNITQTVVIANGASAGDRDSCSPADNNVLAVGDAIKVISDGTPSNAVSAFITVSIEIL
jgi:hypothetical protein